MLTARESRAWVVPLVAILVALGASYLSGASLLHIVAALAFVYVFGTVPGSLLVNADEESHAVSWALIRLIAGLLASTLSYFLTLVLSQNWHIGPVLLCLAAVAIRRRAAFSLPRPRLAPSRDGVTAGVLAAMLLSPVLISSLRMAPGDYPPIFLNVDTPYSLEQVHALSKTRDYPPHSLGNLGGRRSYHVAVHGIAALISRSSRLAPHHTLFLIVLPVLALGIAAAAVILRQQICPALPLAIAVPMLMIMTPSFWYSFWDYIGPRLWLTATTLTVEPLQAVVENYELWGAASIVAQNVGAQFVTLAALGALAAAPSRGWRLVVFLVGTALIVKTSTGIALLAGLLLTQACRAMLERRGQPLIPAVAAAAVFLATYVLFWVVPPVPSEYRAELYSLFQVKWVAGRDGLVGLAADLVWVLLPVLLLVGARIADAGRLSLSMLLFAIAPFLVVNVTRSIDIRPGAGGATDDWIQILLPAPFVLHAFVLAFVGQRWTGLGPALRAAVIVVMALAFLPAAVVAARYSSVLLREPERGHEFVDNRAIAPALAVIPVRGVIVTNDLRYPAQRFSRNNRQMQIPALFGHQAFAVNYAYELFEFSRDRRELQTLLQAPEWSDAIDQAAGQYRWSHLLIRKDYMHPASIPLQRIFENESYAVYRFD
jgi:hypothetical protein